jgi:ATP-dependent protease ClpP protease subunit
VGGMAALIAAHGSSGARVAVPGAHFSFKHLKRNTEQQSMGESDKFLPLLAAILGRDVRKSQADVLEWFQQGAEFTAQEALEHGLIDLVSDFPTTPPSVQPQA